MRTMVPASAKEALVATAKEAKESGDSKLAQASTPPARRKTAELAQKPSSLAEGIRSLHGSNSLCDILLVVGDVAFPAHQAMLSAMSPAFGARLREAKPELQLQPSPALADASDSTAKVPGAEASASAEGGEDKQVSYETIARAALMQKESPDEKPAPDASTEELATGDQAGTQATETQAPADRLFKMHVRGVSIAESVKIMLDYIYQVGTGCAWDYSPSSMEVNKDVLRLSREFELKQLHEYAARWVTRGLTTKNLVERLVICEEFKLGVLRERLIEQLTANPTELSVVCSSAEVLAHPTILQDLLVQVSSLCGITGMSLAPQRSSPQKREAPEEVAEETAPEKPVEDEKSEKAAEKSEKALEKAAAKAEKFPEKSNKENEEEKPEKVHIEKVKLEKEKPEKAPVKVAGKVPPLKKKRTT